MIIIICNINIYNDYNIITISYFFTAVRWQVERQNCEERDAHARYDDVYRVEKRFPSHGDVKSYVQIRFVTTRVDFFVPIKR